MDLTSCPSCGRPAEVEWRDVVESTDGPIELGRVTCVERHWFLLPIAYLDRAQGFPAGTVAWPRTRHEDRPTGSSTGPTI